MAAMEKRFQVFVSSTFQDLVEARQEVMQALLELDCIPAGMELFPAANDDQWTLIKKVIDDCDYYIVVIGGRYGSIGVGGKSYTQMEYEYAVQQKKPVIAFLHKDPSSLQAKHVEKGDDGRKKLEDFRTLAQSRMCKYWTTPTELGSVVSRSVVKLMKTDPAVGWVRADNLPEQGATEEILRLRRQIETLQSDLSQVNTESVLKTEDLAQGDDYIELHFSFASYGDTTKAHAAKQMVTWNEVFGAISPTLMNETSEIRMREAANKAMAEFAHNFLVRSAKYKNHRLGDYKLDDSSFDTVKIQFLALGLIARSAKRAAYWNLTPAGERLMFGIRAQRNPNASATTREKSEVKAD